MGKAAFLKRVADEAEKYVREVEDAVRRRGQASEHDLALSILDAGDDQGWDRLTWTGDSDEYNASYGHDAEGNEFDPVPTASALEFARCLLRDYDIVKKPR